MQITYHAKLNPDRLAQIEEQLVGQHLLINVLKWAQDQPAGTFPPQIIAAIVTQDEYTHDVIVPWGEDLVLVYDTT